MSRYTIGLLIVCGWFVCFRMFPAHLEFKEPPIQGCGNPYSFPTGGPNRSSAHPAYTLFMENCAKCHNDRLERNSTGPALFGLSKRMPGGNWIYDWIQNPAKLIQSGDRYAVHIWEANYKVSMDAFPNLSHAAIDSLMDYIDSYQP